MNYHYPIDDMWSRDEITDVVAFFTMVEKAYEQQIKSEKLMASYRRFKQIVPSKSEEKRLFADFEKASGYASYPVVKKAKETDGLMSM